MCTISQDKPVSYILNMKGIPNSSSIVSIPTFYSINTDFSMEDITLTRNCIFRLYTQNMNSATYKS